MSEYTEETYSELLRRDKHERLAWLAHSVTSLYVSTLRNSDDEDDLLYAIIIRDLGERLAADVIFRGEPLLEDGETLQTLLDESQSCERKHATRFCDDELALAHAATVYRVCVEDFETCLLDI